VSPEQLTAYLRSKVPHSPQLKVTGMEVVPGGRSKETILVSLAGTAELPASVVLRKDRPVGVLQTKAADEFAVLRAVYDHGGVPVAEPFFCDDSKNGLGDGEGTFMIMARVSGHKAGEYFPELAAPAEHHGAIGAQFAAALAHLHAVALDELADTTLDTAAEVSEDSLVASVEGMAARIGQLSGPPSVAVPEARQWLLDHVNDVVPCRTMGLLQGDVGLHNMLIDADRLTALVDWEAATIGPPARELAAAWLAATALMEWSAFVDAYVDAGGPPEATDPRAVTFYRVFFALGACMSSRTGGHLFRIGTKRDLVTAHSGLDAYFRAQRNLSRVLKDALSSD
jgi:aminoglycoside phosphotransferase (APT) family kinase protein